MVNKNWLVAGVRAGRFLSLAFWTFVLICPPLVRAVERWEAPPSVVELKSPIPVTAESIRQGAAIYEDRCADCHGERGRGNGPSAVDLERKPSNLTDPSCGRQSDGALFWKITKGRRPMPAYEKKLKEEERWQLVHFLRTLASKEAKKQ